MASVVDRPKCRHCNHRVACKPRGLCHPCYWDLPTRDLYPRQTPLPCVDDDEIVPSREPAGGVNAPPGSEAKLRLMAERAARGEGLCTKKDEPVEVTLRLAGKPFHERLFFLRRKKRWSKRGLAKRAGVDPMVIVHLERGTWNPRVTTAKKLAVALGEPLAVLLGA